MASISTARTMTASMAPALHQWRTLLPSIQSVRHASHRAEQFESTCVRGSPVHPGLLSAVTTPIVLSSTYQLTDVEHGARLSVQDKSTPFVGDDGFVYARWANPTCDAVARSVARIEGVSHPRGGTRLFSSGMAAMTTALLTTIKAGDHVIAPHGLYGGVRQFLELFGVKKMGVQVTYVDASNHKEYEDKIRANTTVLLAETPCNPTLRLTDLAALGALRLHHGRCITIVDSTFGSPYNQKPLDIPGIDVCMHAATKYLGGHSDILAGVVSSNSGDWMLELGEAQKLLGPCLSPFEAYLLDRGLKTLPVRMQRINATAGRLAQYLHKHPKVAAVHYPGLPSHPDHALAVRQMPGGFGGMMAIEVRGGVRAGRAVAEGLRTVRLAVSLGGVESLISHPATMTHAEVDPETRRAAGISDGVLRFSTGLEHVDDLISDFDQALERV